MGGGAATHHEHGCILMGQSHSYHDNSPDTCREGRKREAFREKGREGGREGGGEGEREGEESGACRRVL